MTSLYEEGIWKAPIGRKLDQHTTNVKPSLTLNAKVKFLMGNEVLVLQLKKEK